jgi:putative membrane protein
MNARIREAAPSLIAIVVLAALGTLSTGPACAQQAEPGPVVSSLSGLPAFLLYFCVSLIVATAYLYTYTRITAHDEFQLIEKNVPGAAISLGLSLLGFAMPVASAVAHAANVIDCIIWSVIALIVQVIIYYLVRIPVPDLSKRIAAGELAPAIWLGLASVTGGLLSAASMTW